MNSISERKDVTPEEYESKIKAVEEAKTKLDTELEAAACRVKRMQNKLVRLHQLPPETLVNIISLSLDTTWSLYNLQNMALVCGRWNEAVLTSPQLWSTISLTQYSSTNNIVLRKNPSAPLQIRCQAASYTREDALDFLRLALPHTNRWQSLVYVGEYSDEVVEILESPAPNVTDYILCQYDSTVYQRHMKLCDGAKVRYLELSGVSAPWDSSRLTGLQTLRITNLSWNVPTLEQLYGLLKSSTNLSSLVLWKIWPDKNVKIGTVVPQTLDLPELGTLILSEIPVEWIECLMRDMVAPSIRIFKIDRVTLPVLQSTSFEALAAKSIQNAKQLQFVCDTTRNRLSITTPTKPHICNDWFTETIEPCVDVYAYLPRGTEDLIKSGVWPDVCRLLRHGAASADALSFELIGEDQSDCAPTIFPKEALLDFPELKTLTARYTFEEALELIAFITKHLPLEEGTIGAEEGKQVMRWPLPNVTTVAVTASNMHTRRQPLADAMLDMIKVRANARLNGVTGFTGVVVAPKALGRIAVYSNVLSEMPPGEVYDGVALTNDP